MAIEADKAPEGLGWSLETWALVGDIPYPATTAAANVSEGEEGVRSGEIIMPWVI